MLLFVGVDIVQKDLIVLVARDGGIVGEQSKKQASKDGPNDNQRWQLVHHGAPPSAGLAAACQPGFRGQIA